MAEENISTQKEESVEASKTVAVPPPKKGNNKALIIVLIVVFFVFVLPGLLIGGAIWWFARDDGGDKLTEAIVENISGENVDINSEDGSFSVKSDDGSFTYGTEELPEGFPSNIPLYEGQKLTSSYRSSTDSGNTWSVTAETNDSVDKVDDYFDEKFTGWTNEGEFAANGTTSTTYRQGTLSVSLTIGKNVSGDKTNISYLVSEDKQN